MGCLVLSPSSYIVYALPQKSDHDLKACPPCSLRTGVPAIVRGDWGDAPCGHSLVEDRVAALRNEFLLYDKAATHSTEGHSHSTTKPPPASMVTPKVAGHSNSGRVPCLLVVHGAMSWTPRRYGQRGMCLQLGSRPFLSPSLLVLVVQAMS